MSRNEQLPVKKRYVAAVILALICIVAYGINKGWFGSTNVGPEVEGTKVSVSQPLDQDSTTKEAAHAAKVAK